jgi:hypothetical protein
MVNVDVRPACLLQQVDFKHEHDITFTLSKIKELFPELYHIPNYQGIILSKTMINESIDNSKKLGEILGYPYKDEFNKIINENISGYFIELICYYKYDDLLYKTQLIVNRCIELNKLNEFKEIQDKAKEYIGYKFDNIELIEFSIHYEKNYTTNEILKYIYEYKPYNEDVIYHIGNIIYNMGIEDTSFITTLFEYDNWKHRYIITLLLIIDNNNIRLPHVTLQPIEWILKKLLNMTK